jgi:hypothetical protein
METARQERIVLGLGLGLLGLAVVPVGGFLAKRDVTPAAARAGLLASWENVGGCGAGASTGSAGGIKWIGRNVRGGLFRVECQANYVDVPDGYNYVATSLVSHDLTPRWNLGVSVPYLYKYMRDPFKVGVDLANKGPGDVSVLLTRRFGDIADWNVTLGVGLPTGSDDVEFRREKLSQDRQLGIGKPTAMLVVDHTIERGWGPIVLGGTANWRGGENDHDAYRTPTGSLYAYAGYLLGPLVPAAGLSLTGFAGKDRDRQQQQALPRASLAANVSLEWSTDWLALLIGASLPYDFAVESETIARQNRWGFWTVGVGAAVAAF